MRHFSKAVINLAPTKSNKRTVISSATSDTKEIDHSPFTQAPNVVADLHKLCTDLPNLKSDFRIPQKKLASPPPFVPLYRKSVLKSIFDAFDRRSKSRGFMEDRFANPIVATQSSPGGGKSFLLDILAGCCNYSSSSLALTSNQLGVEVPSYIKQSTAIPVTFSARTPWTNTIDNNNTNQSFGLAARILFSYFYADANMWSEFGYVLTSVPFLVQNLNVLVAIRVVQYSERSCGRSGSVLLLVDELTKSSTDPSGVTAILSSVGLCLDALLHFNAMVTTLDTLYLTRLTSYYGRPIAWVPLPRFTLEESLQLFRSAFPSLGLSQAIADCSGHPRSLERLAAVYNQLLKGPTPDVSHSTLMSALIADPNLPAPPDYEYVKAALLGALVKPDAVVKGTQHTYRSCVASGIFINTLEDVQRVGLMFVPILSPLQLYKFAFNCRYAEPSEEASIAQCLWNMFNNEPNCQPTQYEIFHANWECIHRILHEGNVEPLLSFYKNPPLHSLSNADPTLLITTKKCVQLASHFPKEDLLAARPLDNQGKAVSLTTSLMIAAGNNPNGFDLLTIEQCADSVSSKIALAIATSLYLQDIRAKHALVMQTFASHLKDGQLPISTIYFVVAAWRNAGKDVVTEDLPQDTIVLTRAELQQLYSPSLCVRPHFYATIADYMEGVTQQAEKEAKKAAKAKNKAKKATEA